jgi:hypothetical protein
MLQSRLKNYLPNHRVDNPIPAFYEVGDIVKMLIGPAKGSYGIVVVERNANYVDNAVYAKPESIGVASTEKIDVDPLLQDALGLGPEQMTETVVRWFDTPAQLKMVSSSKY